MVNEVVMYNSMFLLGMILFGSFAVTFDNYSEDAEDVALESNIEITVQRIGILMLQMLDKAQEMSVLSSSFSINVPVQLEATVAGHAYNLRMGEGENNQIILEGFSSNVEIGAFDLGLVNDTVTNNMFFDGRSKLFSQVGNQLISISWDGINFNIQFVKN
ncbi:MAG: hypothetical protein IH840_12055 [Candidatus Heimdallarchaeota archaeon]|nr:hypothetical protein [Candidatus Heimdallarchaeota archaeon]